VLSNSSRGTTHHQLHARNDSLRHRMLASRGGAHVGAQPQH
jgi:hypothetical protein